MKRWIVTMLLILLVAGVSNAADPNDGLVLWGLSSDLADDAVTARIGLERNKVEFGASFRWFLREPWNEDVDAAGGYILFYPDLIVDIEDPSPNNIFGDSLGALIGKPYVGIEGLIPTSGHRSLDFNWLTGTLISLDPEMKTAMVIEFATGQAVVNDNVLSIGLRIKY